MTAVVADYRTNIQIQALPTHVEKPSEEKSYIRYAILCATILCLSSIMANIVCFNFTVLCMPATHEILHENQTHYVGYNKHDRTALFTAVAIGALIACVPVAHLTNTYGSRKVFCVAGMLTALSTVLIPIAASSNINIFLFLRFMQGISLAACMPTVGAVTASWASLHQNGLFISTLTTFGQLSSVFSMPISGELCESSLGWQSVYYIHGVISLISFTGWYLLYRNKPDDHPWVSKTEMTEIDAGKTSCPGDEDGHIPYLEIITTPSVWGVWIGALGDLVAVQLIHTFSPMYLRTVLQYSVHETGFAAAVPVLFQFFVKIFAGHSSDSIRGISETTKLRIYNSLALGVSALFFIALAFVKQGDATLGIVFMTVATALFGFNGGGFNKCATLVSRQYSPFVLANVQFILCLSMLFCPLIVSILLPTGAVEEWRVVFLAHAVILLVSNLIFCLLATAKPAPWTDHSITHSSKKNTPLYITPGHNLS